LVEVDLGDKRAIDAAFRDLPEGVNKIFGGRYPALVEGGACFSHVVDLLWIVLFPLLYVVA
jgi:hypothetical protein